MKKTILNRCLAVVLAVVMLAGVGAGDWNTEVLQAATAEDQMQEEISDDEREIQDTETEQNDQLYDTVMLSDEPITINLSSTTIQTEETVQLYLSQDGAKVEAAAWASSNTSVAKVDSTGLVTGVSAGSAVITAIYDGSSLECVVSVVRKSAAKTTRYNVLAIDTSGSIKGTPLKREKEAAKRFCKKILDSDGDNYLAVITFDSNATVICGMTNNYSKLEKAINSTTAANSTNMTDAMVKAGELLAQEPDGPNTMKNIVVCSDGLPRKGTKTASGKYTSKDHKYYTYANAAYAASKKLKNKNYFIYGLGFFHNSTGKDLTFGKILMKDIASKDKYYTVNNPNDIDNVFDDIADKITKLAINEKNLTLNVGQKDNLYVTVNGVKTSATWKSSKSSIATVSNGKVTAKKTGTATITATINGKKVTCKVKVINVALSKRSVKVYPGTSQTIKATVQGVSKKVSWKSKNTKIATVKNGKITGKKVGKTVVTMTAGGITKECKVQVLKPTIKLNKTKMTIYIKKSKTLKATVKGKSKKVKWKSSKPAVATVKNGKVTAKRDGTTIITASCNGVKATCKVKVTRKHPGNSHYFVIKPILTKYGNKKVDEYGTRLIVNKGAKVKRCAIYIEYQYNPGLGARIPYYTVACTGTDITSARFEPYFGYNGKVIYSPDNVSTMNRFNMYKNSDGIWTYNSYSLVAKNLTDINGKSPTTYATGIAGKNMKLFTDKQKMINWLKK